jgi:diguanylate cyclase
MQYDFSTVLNNNGVILQDFIDSYTVCVNIGNDIKIESMKIFYEKIFKVIEAPFEAEELLVIFEDLANFKIENDIPYIILSNELYGLKSLLIRNIHGENINQYIVHLLALFLKINNKVGHVYLLKYIDKLISMNNVRRNSLADLVEKNIIRHYESHLVWLTKLAQNIKNDETDTFPELDDTTCDFGIWLHNDAKLIIQNNSKFDSINAIHKNLHLFAKKIFNILGKNEYHVLITYLEKCELISLSIGTELALLDQIQLNKRVTKDTMTGALNRQALRNVFENQYDLALAISSPFILAMCDLDFFKNINDNYGHVAGDKILKLFVDTVKLNIRNSDLIIRYGGEEFIIMLPTIKRDKGYEILERIRSSFEEAALEFNGISIKTTVSIGMIEVKPEYAFQQSHTDEYIMRVDQKLYHAKENGRNRIEVG